MDILKQFDEYSLRARVFPALIAGLPTFTLMLMLVPWDQLGISQIVLTVMVFVLLFALADVARKRGLSVEADLGTRSTLYLWTRSDPSLDAHSKDRYRTFMASTLGVEEPTEAQERRSPTDANDFYGAANTWLRENTRDTSKFRILFDQNLTYGFRRNLLGLKPLSLIANIIVLLLCGLSFAVTNANTAPIANLSEKMITLFAVAFFHTLYMIFAVHKQGVKDASRAYGMQLLRSCDQLIGRPA